MFTWGSQLVTILPTRILGVCEITRLAPGDGRSECATDRAAAV
jgi:hypothetical protein